MKKAVLIFVIVTLMTKFVYGQVVPFTFGPDIGWLSTKISTNLNDNYSDFKSAARTGFQYGAFFRFGTKTYLEPEIYLSSKGGIMNYDVPSTTGTPGQSVSEDINLRTIDIPLLLGHRFMKLPEFNFRVFLGPVASFIVNKNINLTQGSDNSQLLSNSDFKNSIWSGQVGAGIDVFMFTFNVRYEFGLNNISNSPFLSNTRSNLFLFTIGWKLL